MKTADMAHFQKRLADRQTLIERHYNTIIQKGTPPGVPIMLDIDHRRQVQDLRVESFVDHII